MYINGQLVIAKNGEEDIAIIPKLANRHGLIAGATGTGKTVTLRNMAESFSDAGIPVFLADVKGDLASIVKSHPANFWDIYGQKGLPLRTTVSEMGPTLLARLMDLTKTQEDILSIVFKIADDEGLLLIDTKDLRSMLAYVAENSAEYSNAYGNMSKASLNVIQRNIVALEEQGADIFFGEPALDIRDWFRTNCDGKGVINIMHSESLINNPKMYSTFMLWLLSELFEVLPEAGDLAKPKMIFFFDEAHLLFNNAPKALLEKIEQVVKLIRSKGVGVYFVTQNPKDIPDGVLGQLGNKIQHALRAYTPADQKAIKAAADSFRINPAFDTKEVIEQLGIGEALISFLQEDGTPAMVQRAKVILPEGVLGPISDDERKNAILNSEFSVKYSDAVDRDSAYEFLQRIKVQAEEEAAREKEEAERAKEEKAAELKAQKEAAKAEKEAAAKAAKAEKARKTAVSNVAKTAGGTIGREVGNAIGKTVGGSFGKKLGGNVGASIGRGILGSLFGK
ncbi:MAG: helicase HerA-like domain-containing protein [Lachnospiraceae bacterium]